MVLSSNYRELFLRAKYFLSPYIIVVSVKETFLEYRRDHILQWLREHVKCGWKSVGYVPPPRIEYFMDHDGERHAIPYAYVGFTFKNVSEAVMFKLALNDL